MQSSEFSTVIPVFDFNAESYRSEWAEQGYLHIKNGVSSEFFEFILQQAQNQIEQSDGKLRDLNIPGKKSQFLFEFGSQFDFPTGLYKQVAELTGLNVNRLTLCERHFKFYDPNADPNPIPHKDRLASEVVVGIPISVTESSFLALYTSASGLENPFQSTAQWRAIVSSPDQTSKDLNDVTPIKLYAQSGDVIIFKGSSTFHERYNGANSILLFFKFNSMRMDPLGEDPSTIRYETNTETILETLQDEDLLSQRLEVSPRLHKLTAYYRRRDWKPIYLAALSPDEEVLIDSLEFGIIELLDAGERSGRDILGALGEISANELSASIRRLCSKKLVLIPNGYPYQSSRKNDHQTPNC